MSIFWNFIKTGMLGEITLGATSKYIQEYLGKPEDISSSRKPLILKYGSLQLAFNRDKKSGDDILNSINIYFDEDVRIPDILSNQGWFPKMKMPRYDFFKKLSKFEICLELDKQHTFNKLQLGYKSEADVVVIFNSKETIETLAGVFLTMKQ